MEATLSSLEKNKELHNEICELYEEKISTRSPSLKNILQKDLNNELKKLGPKLIDVTEW